MRLGTYNIRIYLITNIPKLSYQLGLRHLLKVTKIDTVFPDGSWLKIFGFLRLRVLISKGL